MDSTVEVSVSANNHGRAKQISRLPVGILGATGAVGQRFVELLADHPWFEVAEVTASERSAGKSYAEAADWQGDGPIPAALSSLEVKPTQPGIACRIVFSSLPAAEAQDVERRFAQAGYVVISNSSAYRMDDTVPLLIPEVNPDHLSLARRQSTFPEGMIITNPNCSTIGLVSALKPLEDAFGLESVHVTTLQALSGAGYPGVASLDAVGNVIPHIGGEEGKLESEPLKLLGALEGDRIRAAGFRVSAQCNRVPVIDGHLLCISAKFRRAAGPDDVVDAIRSYEVPAVVHGLPSAPAQFLHVFEDDDSPQPRRHVGLGNGMTVSVGRVRKCEIFDVRFIALVHNTIRGAAGGAILNAELVVTSERLSV